MIPRRLLTLQAKWDIDDLHRHSDFVPIKKEPAQKQTSEDDDLPPRPSNVEKHESNGDKPAYDGDGEFGSAYTSNILSASNNYR